ncbi:MAG: SCO1664 family protein [Actinomycetota bacterium]
MSGRQRPPCSRSGLTLLDGEIEIIGLLSGASNYTLLGRIGEQMVVYKPRRGESPLWDFATGTLFQREAAAYLVCEMLGWDFVPVTVCRDGPLGPGSVQRFIDHDPSVTAFDLVESHTPELMRIALFDLVVNNADRKAGHVLLSDGRLFAVDHGLCFHEESKLRTVLWDFIGMPIPADDLRSIQGLTGESFSGLLSEREIRALQSRVETITDVGVFPPPGPGRPYPWPPV